MTNRTVIVSNIQLRTRESIIKFAHDPQTCSHDWEFHLWDCGDAYCPLCGSLATADNDPRVDRSGGHVRYRMGDGWQCSSACLECRKAPP